MPEGDVETWTDGKDIHFTQGIDEEPTQDEPMTSNDNIVIACKDLSGETVGMKNSGSKNIDVIGWTLVSFKGNQTYAFPDGFILRAGRTVM
ncbi:lamin tail domain-containing protein [Domibacillus indicus]|uniref:lamin tail domain-containing protein n=1 Tax=Domibacillus indicus TaxID=1437523 RepID=UPI00203F9125|nr:lamin tail domain-containing protein [Domibacillus indicus]MCM3788200.1 lamin tail domain-containing protein [Domibacillus indicus]